MEFYRNVLTSKELGEMKEDFIEQTTNLLLSGSMYQVLFAFF